MQDQEVKRLLEEINEGFKSHRDDVEETIRKTVNGKIDALTRNFNEWKVTETEKRTAIEKQLNEYMITTEPVVKFFTDMNTAKKILFYCLSAVTLVGSTWLVVKGVFTK